MRSRAWDRCACCELPLPMCFGPLGRLVVKTRVVVVAHHVEARKTSNTGRLVVRLIEGASMRIRGLSREAPAPAPAGRSLALYPGEDARVLSPEDAGDLTLLVPDGSWPQARRIARRDPWIKDVEKVRLPDVGESRYRLRRRPREGTLSTFEAVIAALAILEGTAIEETLLVPFEAFVARALLLRARNERQAPRDTKISP